MEPNMAAKKDNSPAKGEEPTAERVSSRKISLLRGMGVLLFLGASGVLFVDIAGIHAAGGFFAGKAIFMLPVQLATVALVDFANTRIRQHEFSVLQSEQSQFHHRTADKTADLERNIANHLHEVYQRTLEERDAVRKELEELKEQENRKLFEQLERLREEKSELEARLINMKFRDTGKKEEEEGGKIFAA